MVIFLMVITPASPILGILCKRCSLKAIGPVSEAMVYRTSLFGKTFYWRNHCHRKAPAIIVISGAFLLGKTFYLIFT
ncbi:hypothetical protein D4100_02955 [Serratia inhibens]|uniref:Uncharacterized protein n=1 Tax=Serratia inhibens TaxID=2338073 RepID=A0AA92X5T9_9GAMM|nr:hypothetical protein D4100_02955 [Serratia inhibens]